MEEHDILGAVSSKGRLDDQNGYMAILRGGACKIEESLQQAKQAVVVLD